jgi:peptidoglycan/xylan/chitin deacetylase (PgdA/CDA1 family)/GT2 family glycosyltransferase
MDPHTPGGIRLTVVIATWNRQAIIASTLPAIFDQAIQAHEYEVVVVVDGSTDSTAAYLKSLAWPNLRIIVQPHRGLAAARNAGIEAARGRLVLFLDDDFYCGTDLLANHLSCHENGSGKMVVFGPILPFNSGGKNRPSIAAELAASFSESMNSRWREASRTGCAPPLHAAVLVPNFSAPRAFLASLGGFDASFDRGAEDHELGIRACQAGAIFRFCPDAVVKHRNQKKIRDLAREAEEDGRSVVRICRKHPLYRPDSPLARLSQGGWARRLARRLISSAAAGAALQISAEACDALRANPRIRQAGLRFAAALSYSRLLRGAAREAGGRRAIARDFGRRLPVLMYHHVGPARSSPGARYSISPERFENDLRWIRRWGFHTITPQQWLEWRNESAPLPSNPLLITFDDGYSDLAEHAFPLLERYRMSATAFIVTSQIYGHSDWDAPNLRPVRLLSADDIRSWSRRGVTFGSHSHTHPHLTRCSDNELECELRTSRDVLAQILGSAPCSVAYPYGDDDERVGRAAARYYALGFGTREGVNTLAVDPYALWRIEVNSEIRSAELPIRALLGHPLLRRLRERLWEIRHRLPPA